MAFLNVLKYLTSGEKSESEEYALQCVVTHSEVQQKGLRCGALVPFPITRLSRAELRPTAVELEQQSTILKAVRLTQWFVSG